MLSSARSLSLWSCTVLCVIVLILSHTRADAAGTIKVGALLARDSRIGREAERALRLALESINNDTTILKGRPLDLVVANSNCSAFQGVAAAIELFGEDVVAIAGPQTSVASHFVAQMGAASQIPLVSFSATDASLSEYQYSYFVRLAQSDKLQMDAIAHIIHLFGWSEVVALYSNDLETGSMEALDDSISGTGIRIVQKEGLDPDTDKNGIVKLLTQLTQLGSRVYVVHMSASLSRSLFIEAYNLGMMSTGFVWIVTEETASVLDSIFLDDTFVRSIQGLIGIRSYIPKTSELRLFMDRWKNSVSNETTITKLDPISSYGLYAYDSLWVIAKAIEMFLYQISNITFLSSNRFKDSPGEHTDLAKLKTLNNGSALLQAILETNFTGITGNIQFDSRGDLRGSAMEVVNMVGKNPHTVGYWTPETGLFSSSKRQDPTTGQQTGDAETLENIVWPGGGIEVPRGWAFPRSGKPLQVAVPDKQGYKEFVNVQAVAQNNTKFTGFCIDVFVAACQLLPYHIEYKFIPFGNGNQTPSYDELVQTIASEEFDAAVGDITITTKRSKYVDFTQPFAESGLVVLVPIKQSNSNLTWTFIRPFTPEMWLTTLVAFLFSGLVVWVLEHKKNDEFRGNPKKQIVNILWFIFSTLFFSQKEEVRSTLGKFAVIVWLFVVLIINSSYTASLTSNLTVQQLLPTIQNIGGLVSSNVRIGFQAGSFVHDYLVELSVSESRLVPLNSIEAYAAALRKGMVGAIVDELPYVQLFLSSQCDFTIAGSEFTKSGWGFAFPKGSQLAADLSTAILQLSENGKLQQIHDSWLEQPICSSTGVITNSNELGLNTFWGLFLITGVTSIVCCVFYYVRLLRRFILTPRTYPDSWESMPTISRGASLVRSFILFVDKKEERRSSSRSVGYDTSYGHRSSPDENTAASMGRIADGSTEQDH